MGTKDVHRTFRLSADLDRKLAAKAEKVDRSVNWVIERALEAVLEGEQVALGRAVIRGRRER